MKIRETKIKNFKFITLIVILFSISCGNNSKNLETKLNEYKKTYENGDYVKMSSFVLPGLIEQFGGTENFVNTMNSLPELFLGMGMEVDMKKMKFGELGKILSKSNYLISVVPTTLPIKINNVEGVIKSSVICFSQDNGETWFFIEGNDEGRSSISNTNPEIIQMINVPLPEMNINGKTMVQKGGNWVEK
jgi:hypothetical protein